MALSNSVDFSLNRDQLISAAFRKLGIYGAGLNETPSTQELTDASITLNSVVKSWIADGEQLWVTQRTSLPVIADKQSYTVGIGGDVNIQRPEHLIYAVYRNDNFDRPIEIYSRQRYWSLSRKDSKGEITGVYYDPQLTLGILFVWPVPNIATNKSLELFFQNPFDDLDSATDDFEFPQYWFNALTWALAAELAFEYGLPDQRLIMIQTKARAEKENALSYDTEKQSIFFQPNNRFYRGV